MSEHTGPRSSRFVPKPWGHEVVWAECGEYVGKLLHVRAGEALSLQYHELKQETIHVLRGELLYEVGPNADQLEEVRLNEGESYLTAPGSVHRMTAITDCDVLEASTPHLDDIVRLEDRYGREGTREA